MNETINKLNDLRKHLTRRNDELKNLLEDWEDRLTMAEEETAEYEDLCKLCHGARSELRVNSKLLNDLAHTYPCEYCKLSDHNLCDFCC